MTDIQAALGISQLERLDAFLQTRKEIAERYEHLLSDFPLYKQNRQIRSSANHLFVIQLENAQQRLGVFNYLRAKNIGVNVHYIPIYRQPYYRNLGFDPSLFESMENYYKRCISLPIYHGLNSDQGTRCLFIGRSN